MSYLVLKFREIMLGFNENDELSNSDIIYGYKISIDNNENKTLILEIINNNYWKTRWITNSSSKKIIEPLKTLSSIFN